MMDAFAGPRDPLSNVMEKAAAIKSAQLKTERRFFDALPEYVQVRPPRQSPSAASIREPGDGPAPSASAPPQPLTSRALARPPVGGSGLLRR